jgi:hypothetical protein
MSVICICKSAAQKMCAHLEHMQPGSPRAANPEFGIKIARPLGLV